MRTHLRLPQNQSLTLSLRSQSSPVTGQSTPSSLNQSVVGPLARRDPQKDAFGSHRGGGAIKRGQRGLDPDFSILIVCTANLCRSPIAQHLLASTLSEWKGDGEWIISSAGVSAADQLPMHKFAREVLARRGSYDEQFRTRRLSRSLLEDADLVLTATRQHRSDVARMVPAVMQRLFTIRQFGFLLAHSDVVKPAHNAHAVGNALIASAISARGRVAARTIDDDLQDPVSRPVRAFEHCAKLIQSDFEQLARVVQ